MRGSDEIEKFANNVIAQRLTRRWSQTELAEKVGVSLPTICRLEQMQRKPSLWVAYAICKVLGVSLDDMCNKEYPIPNVATRMVGKRRSNYERT